MPIDTPTARNYGLGIKVFATTAGALLLATLAAAALAGSTSASGHIQVHRVAAVDDRFVPRVANIRRGQAIRWVFPRRNFNPHNVTPTRLPRGVARRVFTSPRAMPPGSAFARRFVRPGRYQFACTLHPGMNMRVNVRRR